MQITYIDIDRLKIFARHGVSDQERRVGNMFEVSVRIYYDFGPAAKTDDVNRSINYAQVVDIVIESMKTPRRLLETAVNDIKTAISLRWPEVKSGRISLSKVHPPFTTPVEHVSAVMEWSDITT